MTFHAMTERYEEITVCRKPALFTSIRIKRDTVPDEKPPVLSIILRKERKIMVNKPQDFLTLTGAARRARSEGYDITYHSLRNLVAAGYISHVPNGSRIYIFYPNLVNFIQNGLTAEQSLEYQLSRARN